MVKTLEKMTETQMQELCEKLVGMKINKARGYVRRLDPDSELQMLRVGVKDEILTVIVLPNLGVKVTLVEKVHNVPKGENNKLRAEFKFVEARTEALA